VEDHKKHVDWLRAIHPDLLVSVKVSTPADVDMVAVGSYHAGANIIHLDGAYGGTGAAPDIAKKNIAQPIEYATVQVHDFLVREGIRDDVVLVVSGGIRTPEDVLKSIALGADGVVIGTAELVAIDCVRCGNCERDRGCPLGIATTDPDLSVQMTAEWVSDRIVNLYASWAAHMEKRLRGLGMRRVAELRGRRDLLAFEGNTGECSHG
jgi:glutamate synthase domain-containing protein 2